MTQEKEPSLKIEHMDCNNCVFRELKGRTQCGCKILDKDKVKVSGETLYGNWALEGLCQFKRTDQWYFLDDNPSEEECIEKTKEEAQVSFWIGIKSGIENCLAAKSNYPKTEINLYYDNHEKYLKDIEHDEGYIKTILLTNDLDWRVMHGRANRDHSFIGFFEDYSKVPYDLLYKINKKINNNELRIACAKGYGGILMSRAIFENVKMSIDDILIICERKNLITDLENI